MPLRYPAQSISLCSEYEQGLSCLGFGDLRERVMAGYGERVNERVFGYGHMRIDLETTSTSGRVG